MLSDGWSLRQNVSNFKYNDGRQSCLHLQGSLFAGGPLYVCFFGGGNQGWVNNFKGNTGGTGSLHCAHCRLSPPLRRSHATTRPR